MKHKKVLICIALVVDVLLQWGYVHANTEPAIENRNNTVMDREGKENVSRDCTDFMLGCCFDN
ncbi:MAG: hypothetical protein NT150_00210 [Bacteroidetes bacterium]|nr:hypothetical protein [Bacteroidota bacterium]